MEQLSAESNISPYPRETEYSFLKTIRESNSFRLIKKTQNFTNTLPFMNQVLFL